MLSNHFSLSSLLGRQSLSLRKDGISGLTFQAWESAILWESGMSWIKYSISPGLSEFFSSWILEAIRKAVRASLIISRLPKLKEYCGRHRVWEGQTQLQFPQDLWLEKRERTGHCTHPLAGPPSSPLPSSRYCLHWKQRGNIVSSQICWALGLNHWTWPRWPLYKRFCLTSSRKSKSWG